MKKPAPLSARRRPSAAAASVAVFGPVVHFRPEIFTLDAVTRVAEAMGRLPRKGSKPDRDGMEKLTERLEQAAKTFERNARVSPTADLARRLRLAAKAGAAMIDALGGPSPWQERRQHIAKATRIHRLVEAGELDWIGMGDTPAVGPPEIIAKALLRGPPRQSRGRMLLACRLLEDLTAMAASAALTAPQNPPNPQYRTAVADLMRAIMDAYEKAFGRPAGLSKQSDTSPQPGAPGGPAFRFVRAVLVELRRAYSGHGDHRKDLLERLPPTDAAIAQAMKRSRTGTPAKTR